MTRPIISEYGGTVQFEGVVDNVTVMSQTDEVTGLSSLVVIDPKRSTAVGAKGKKGSTQALRPAVRLVDENGNEVKIPGTDHRVTIQLPVGALIVVRDGQKIGRGEVLARIPVESHVFRLNRKRPAILRAVCRVWQSSLKLVRPRTPAFWPK